MGLKRIRHNCIKEKDFKYSEIPVFSHQPSVIECKICQAKFKEIMEDDFNLTTNVGKLPEEDLKDDK